MGYRIIVADDEAEIRELFRLYLEKEGYEVLEAADGEEALDLLAKEKDIAMLILDIMMPKKDGFHVLKEIREQRNLPVIILSAKTTDNDKILGLDLGADDYIGKPFNPLEAVARINSNIRRFYSLGANDSKAAKKILKVKDLTLDLDSCILRRGEEVIELSSTEYRLMELFMSNPGKIYTKQQIILLQITILWYVSVNYEQSCQRMETVISVPCVVLDIVLKRNEERDEREKTDRYLYYTKFFTGGSGNCDM